MVSVFLREQKRYSQDELIKTFQTTEEKTVRVLKRLKEYGILKAVKADDTQKDLTELIEDDIEIADVEEGENAYYYVFTFVGVVTLENLILKCYPKYISSRNAPVRELKQVLKVLSKYNSKEEIIKMYNVTSNSTSFNMLAVMLYLLNDYYEYGPYTNTEDIIQTNGTGEILWDKTINETFTLLSDNRPYYPELMTRKNVIDEYDYFKRLHECIVSRCSRELENADLLELFDIAGIDASDEELVDFGDTDHILDSLEKELNIQFNTRKQLVLKTLYAYVLNESKAQGLDCFSMFGTNSFNLVWEDVCAQVLNNQLNKPLSSLNLRSGLSEKYRKNRSTNLIDMIAKPEWYIEATGRSYHKDTLIPDLISVGFDEDKSYFAIFDAKYYCIDVRRGALKGNPGIESVTKQYLYQQAYNQFIADHQLQVFNAFLFPTEEEKVIDVGFVKLEMMSQLGLKDILLRMLPAEKLYTLYLKNKHIHPLEVLNL